MQNPLKESQKYPITIKCVVASLSERNPDVIKIRKFAHSMNIMFMTREFNSKKFSNDCNYITHLPSFHIYINSAYRDTFYIHNSYEIIQKVIREYEEIKHNTFYTGLKNIFKVKLSLQGL